MMLNDSPQRPIVLIGAGGHAKVVLSVALVTGRNVIGVVDPRLACDGVVSWRDIPVLGDDNSVLGLNPDKVELANGVGQVVGGSLREKIYDSFVSHGFRFATLVHPSAWVAGDVTLEYGVQIMAGVVLQPDVTVGFNSVINTGARVDHDCRIGSNVHVAPGAILCGNVDVGSGAFVGAGSVLIQGTAVGSGAVVGAGVTLTRDLARHKILLGAPSRLKAN